MPVRATLTFEPAGLQMATENREHEASVERVAHAVHTPLLLLLQSIENK